MSLVPGWALISAITAPTALIGGWTVAAQAQPAGFDSSSDTISALAGYAATDRAIMTAALVVVGVCYALTSIGLRGVAAWPGRAMLAVAGVATVAVACFPLPVTGASTGHFLAAAVTFGTLALWPALAWHRLDHDGPRSCAPAPWALRPGVSISAAVLLSVLIAIVVASMAAGELVGLTERVAAGAESLWPLVVVGSARLITRKP